MWKYRLASLLFHIFHSSLVLFIILGWLSPHTRPYHLILLGIVLASWYLLGLWYYPGYCILTDYHFRLLRRLKIDPGTHSYIQYLLERLTPFRFNESKLERHITILFFIVALLSITLYLLPAILNRLGISPVNHF